MGLDLTAKCPGCETAIGEHTLKAYEDCLTKAGFNYVLPFEDVPDGPIMFPGLEGDVVGEASVAAGFVDTPMGRVPLLRFVFTGPGADPMSRRSLKPINLLLDANGLKTFRQLVSTSVDRAILGARRGR